MIQKSGEYYSLALSAAASGNLSGAARLSLCALSLSEDEEKARRLLGICLLEMGKTGQAATFLAQCPDLAQQSEEEQLKVKNALALIKQQHGNGRWREALKTAQSVGRDSVRFLCIEGCLLAEAGRYTQAGKRFALALEKDSGSVTASACLRETANCIKPTWWSK